jgi:deazaflavin-dependent oxidoreductase (nitroreductase family)
MDIKAINRRVIEQFRAGGEIQGMHRERLVLLTTTGRRTGRRHTVPMMIHREGDRMFVMASNQGDPKEPDWFGNLVANPRVTVEVGDERWEGDATPLKGAERDRQWARITEAWPFFSDHEKKAGRTIPVVSLTRQPAGPPAGRTEPKPARSGPRRPRRG